MLNRIMLCAAVLYTMTMHDICAQIVNNGAGITISSGATLRLETSLLNNAGSLQNNGTIELTGNFTNSANFSSGATSLVKFTGNATASVTSGSGIFQNVELAKTAQTVQLTDDMTIQGQLEFSAASNKLILGDHDVILGSAATVTGAGTDKYLATNGTGIVRKNISQNGTFTFPVGDLTGSRYTPLTIAYTGSMTTMANIAVKVSDAVHPSKPADADAFITRYWVVSGSGIINFNATLTGTYLSDDVSGTASLIKGASYSASTWNYAGASGNTLTVAGAVNAINSDFTGTNFFGKATLKVFLAGPLSGSTMTTALNSLLPLTTPYAAAPWDAPSVTVTSVPATATDWILVEARDPANPATVIAKASGFLLSDGSIVAPNGSPFQIKNALPTSIIAIHHRNHLSIRTATGLDLITPSLHDFTTAGSQAYINPAISNPNMSQVGTVFAMWAGNANSNNTIRYTGPLNDNTVLLNTILSGSKSAILNNVYSPGDFNMNGTVRYTGPLNDNTILLNTTLGGSKSAIYTQHI